MAWTTPTWGSRTDGDILTAAQVNDLRDSLRALAGTDATGPAMLVVNGQASAPAAPAGEDVRIYSLTADDRLRAINSAGTIYQIGADSGSFTPAITGSTGSAGTYAASTAVGRWWRQGDLVTFFAYIVLSSKGSWTGDARLNTPAITSVNSTEQFGIVTIPFWNNLAVSAVSMSGNVQVNSQLVTLRINTAATASSRTALMADLNDTSQIAYGGFYRAA